jgi:hypothetical protein
MQGLFKSIFTMENGEGTYLLAGKFGEGRDGGTDVGG